MYRPSLSLFGALVIGVSASLVPAQAHKTEVSSDVAGTWHLEPDHSAKAGEPARVWVALTQQGGRVIPLDQCDCKLAVYRASQAEGPPTMQPVLKALSPESFENIPGAEITFPEVGEYRIVLTGSPRTDAAFAPFELSYTTVVAAGSTAIPVPQTGDSLPVDSQHDLVQTSVLSNSEEQTAQTQLGPRLWIMGWAVGVVGAAIALFLLLRSNLTNF
ncbi:MAG: hypothetical protein WBG38_11710 [Nodosilinea sp.]